MSTTPIFSKEYYTHPRLFVKEAMAPAVVESGLFTDLLEVRTTHACVDSNGTIGIVPFSLLDNVKRCFTFTQDPNLIAVHQKLKSLEKQIQDPSSSTLQAFKHEVENKGRREARPGTYMLMLNIDKLSALFEQGNEKSPVTLTLLKVVNFVRNLLSLQPIKYFHFEPINRQLFTEKMIQPALEFTLKPLPQSKFNPTIQYSSDAPPGESIKKILHELRAVLTKENVHKLEYGELEKLDFSIDEKELSLKFDHEKKEFVLHYLKSSDINNTTTLELLNSNDRPYDIHREPFLNVTEEKSDRTKSIRKLKYFFEASHLKRIWHNRTWHDFFTGSRYQCHIPGSMNLTAGCKYTILFSQGKLSLKFSRQN